MKMRAFASRNSREILRDRLNVIFGLGFPLIVLLLLTLIQSNVPVELFELNKLTPGVAVFGLSFVSLFSATIISKDRSSSLMLRLYSSPLRPADYILGYTLPLLPISLAQSIICFVVAMLLGLEWSVNILLSIVVLIPAMIVFIAIGLICGTLLNDKQVGGVCGALLTNLTAWLSDIWFDVSLVGDVFEKIANALPFIHAVKAGRYAYSGEYSAIMPELWWVIGYAAVLMLIAVVVFKRKMKV
ncbi:MAG: ABC transporter permease [Oscillospiraceae bacterium]|nr:ABC transporter permease [Oscillospiraceae bacterium]